MAKFKQGESGNPSGRKKGSRNCSTEMVRELIKNFVEDNWDDLQKDYKLVIPSERLQFINNLIKHFLPEPVSLERLSDSQLEQLHSYLLKKISDEEATKN
jgi:hypothetical protein